MNFDLKTYLLNECDRLITIFKPITISRVHIHKGKRVHINAKTAILGYPTINMIKHTKKGLKR
jgi:hypothetical protein